MDWMRDVLFKDLTDLVNDYRNTFNVRPETEHCNIPLPSPSENPFVDETQSVGFGTQPNPALSSQEVPETDHGSVHESIESVHLDSLTATQALSLSNATNEQKYVKIDERD